MWKIASSPRLLYTTTLEHNVCEYSNPREAAVHVTHWVIQDTVKCANVEKNGGTCSWPACGCAEPPKSK